MAGFYLGNLLALAWGPKIFQLTATKIEFIPIYLLYAVLIAPAVCVLSSYLPAFIAVQQDPAEVLREV